MRVERVTEGGDGRSEVGCAKEGVEREEGVRGKGGRSGKSLEGKGERKSRTTTASANPLCTTSGSIDLAR